MMIGYILLVIGLVVFVLSFMIPVKTEDEKATEFSEDVIKDLVGKEVESAKVQINDIVDETINYAMEKTERSMDRITNEKMMAVNEYSDTVLSEINKNHQEVVFLYDMLNDKHENLKDAVSEMDRKASEAKQVVMDAAITAEETRTSAIERLKELQAEKEEEIVEDFTPMSVPTVEIEAPKPKKKRTTKPKVKEEAVVFDNNAILDSSFDPNLELITTEEVPDNKVKKEGPNLNLGVDGAGKAVGGRNKNDKILELHNLGKSNMAIAKELGLGIGEVKLVIDLFEGM
ncbi:MAG: DUF6115 domain-containing protein [Lachnospiraceae bacterium]|nr:DUF6115 domain-containing protein [Lachnospiraceae bacterium]